MTPEVAAAPAAGDQPHRAPVRDAVLPRARRAARAPRTRSRASSSAPARSTTTSSATPAARATRRVAIGRVELLYPFPEAQILELVDELPEPARGRLGPGGAAQHGRPRAHVPAPHADPAPSTCAFGYIGRPERASPGEGYPAAHIAEQNRILRTALDLSAARLAVPGQDAGRALSVALPRAVVFDLDDTLLDTTGPRARDARRAVRGGQRGAARRRVRPPAHALPRRPRRPLRARAAAARSTSPPTGACT